MSFIFPTISAPALVLEAQAGEETPLRQMPSVGTASRSFGALDGLLATEVEILALASVFALLDELHQREPGQPSAAASAEADNAGACEPANTGAYPTTVAAQAGAAVRRQALTAPPARNNGMTPVTELPLHVRYRSEIITAARRHNISPVILAAVAAQETGGPGSDSGANVVGADGTGHGVFQIDSGTWSSWLRSHDNGMDVAQNADKAAAILADNLQRTGGDIRRALHLYNAGSESRVSTTTTWPDGQTLSYEDSVLRHVARLQG